MRSRAPPYRGKSSSELWTVTHLVAWFCVSTCAVNRQRFKPRTLFELQIGSLGQTILTYRYTPHTKLCNLVSTAYTLPALSLSLLPVEPGPVISLPSLARVLLPLPVPVQGIRPPRLKLLRRIVLVRVLYSVQTRTS
jgi:hypothetical protein